MSRLDQLLSPRHLSFWALLASIATVIALVITIVQLAGGLGPSRRAAGPSSPASPFVVSPTQGPPSNGVPSSSPTSSPGNNAAGEVVTYLDDHARDCGVAVTTGPMSMNSTPYVHAIHQWAGFTTDAFNIARAARRFEATIGIRDDARSEVQARFELLGDNGQRLFTSKVIGFGQTESVDVPVDGVLRITLVVNAVSKVWGYAGWADARVTSASKLPC